MLRYDTALTDIVTEPITYEPSFDYNTLGRGNGPDTPHPARDLGYYRR
jgi:hypothetical protein